MLTPLTMANALRIGKVDFVSPDEIKVLLDAETPNSVALNTGYPHPFPRINSYVLIPSEGGFLIAQIEWITIEHSQYPKHNMSLDANLINLPFPFRKMSLNPIGVLREKDSGLEEVKYSFSRGVEVYPTVGDPVLLPTQRVLKAILESGENRKVKIGTSSISGNAEVSIDPDRLFGRHLAILGNTGSGKSCSVAGVIRWSIEAANGKCTGSICNSRFIVLDPNGEYSRAFEGLGNVRVFAVEANKETEQLQVPLWLWNSSEWCAFTQASGKAQRPTLIQALRTVRDGLHSADSSATPSHNMRRFLRTLVSTIDSENKRGSPWDTFPQPKHFYKKIKKWNEELNPDDSFNEYEYQALNALKDKISTLIAEREVKYPHYDFTLSDIKDLLTLASKAHSAFGGSDRGVLPIDADIPRPFNGDDLLRSLEMNAELMGTTEYTETMLMRIRTLLSDSRMKVITSSSPDLTLEKWLETYICPTNSKAGSITVIDLSLVPAEVVHIITAVIARMTLEALQRYRHINGGKTLPTTLVMEEAHTFIHKYVGDAEEVNPRSMCTQVFEKISREGRKFGLGLVLSSQRPSELSQTVLSQCNTFLLHRISNDKDQELVNKLVPDNLRGLLRELPLLPSRKAILLGWASELPVLVEMNYLKEEYRPKSDDPEYWKSWTNNGDNAHTVDWRKIADSWQEKESETNGGAIDTVEKPIDEDDDLPF